MKTVVLFVDDEEMVLKGLRRMLSPRSNEWDMLFARGGEEALALMEKKPVNVIVADLLMPGMDGYALLNEVRTRYPHVKRIVLTGQPEREMSREKAFPAHQFLMKPCDYATLSKIIEDILFVDRILIDPRARNVLPRIETLPALPQIYQDVSLELESAAPSLDRVVELISRDVGLAAKLIALVNSPYYGYHRPISDVKYAITYLGLDMIRTLVLTCKVFEMYDQTKLPGFSLELLWEHSQRTACLAKRISLLEGGGRQESDAAFLAGLLHDVGKLVLASHFQEQYGEILRLVRRESRPIHELEREVAGATHAEIGAYLMGLWGVRPGVVKAMALHHEQETVVGDSVEAIVFFANILDHRLTVIHPDYSRRDEGLDERLDPLSLARLKEWNKVTEDYLKEHCP